MSSRWLLLSGVWLLYGSFGLVATSLAPMASLIMLALSAAAFLASLLLRFSEPESLLTGLLLQGIARSTLMTVLILTLVELPEIGEKYAGVASGLFFSAAELGGVMGPLILGWLYSPDAGFGSGLTLLTVIALTMIVGSLMLRQRAHRK